MKSQEKFGLKFEQTKECVNEQKGMQKRTNDKREEKMIIYSIRFY